MTIPMFDVDSIGPETPRIAWSPPTNDLHMNVVILRPGDSIPAHINVALDVIVTVIQGTGSIEITGARHMLHAGTIVLIPKGHERCIEAGQSGLVYTTVHQKRGGIMPTTER